MNREKGTAHRFVQDVPLLYVWNSLRAIILPSIVWLATLGEHQLSTPSGTHCNVVSNQS